jgi:hypothetical protein
MRRLEFHISKVIEVPVVFAAVFQLLVTDRYTIGLNVASSPWRISYLIDS